MNVAESQPAVSKPKLRWYRYSLWYLLSAMALVALFFVLDLVGFHYPREVIDDPLLSPVRVLSVRNKTLYLEDGRALRMDDSLLQGSIIDLIQASDNRVDVEPDRSQKLVVFVKKRRPICGTRWAQFVIIPLFPDDVQINHRELLGCATIGAIPSETQK